MKIQVLLLISICMVFIACKGNRSTSTILNSYDFENTNDRIEQLSNEITVYSKIQDAEFELFNVNGFSNQRLSVPGASSWDYKIAVRINKSDIAKWTLGMADTTLSNYDDSWIKEITNYRKKNWQTKSLPKFYFRKGVDVRMLVYEPEGIIFKRVINQ